MKGLICMGKLTGQLKRLLDGQVNKAGIVVWYDPEGSYLQVAPALNIEGAAFVAFDGSYFKVRQAVEPLLAGTERPRLLVYVKADRDTQSPPLIELEAAGTVCEPGAPTGRNTKLEVIARATLKAEGWPAARIEEEIANIASGYHGIEDVERIIEHGPIAGTGSLALVYGATAGTEIALKFLTNPAPDDSLVSKNALPELTALVETTFGLCLPEGQEPKQVRTALTRHVLLTDFVAGLPKGTEVAALSAVQLPARKVHVEACAGLVSMWRHRSDLCESYARAADEVEREYGLASAEAAPEMLGEIETFGYVERSLLCNAEELLLADRWSDALALAEKRRTRFWATHSGTSALRWSLVSTAALLLGTAQRVRVQAKQAKLTATEMVSAYAQGIGVTGGAWSEVDYHHRVLERQYAELDLAGERDRDQIEQVVSKARSAYTEAANDLAERFTDALIKAKFELAGCRHQSEVFKMEVGPHLGSAKLGYLWVDALRYEMAQDLARGLDEDVSIEPAVAVAPTLTALGMAALLPGAEAGLGIVKLSESAIAVEVEGEAVKDRGSRLALLESRVKHSLTAVKLDDVVRLKKSTRQRIERSDLVVVTSREIDELCEQEEEAMARHFMENLLGLLKRAIRTLADCGVERIVIAADHGYLFGEALDSSMKMDPPGGSTIQLHRRAWIGSGGSDNPSYFRVSASELGLSGGLEFAFPRSLAAFKAKGGSQSYFHGGMSLQELVVPVLVVRCKKRAAESAEGISYELEPASPQITTRMFTVRAGYSAAGFFGPDQISVVFQVMKGKTQIGAAATAMYGFQGSTKEVTLRRGEPNHVTLLLEGDDMKGKLSVRMLDPDSQAELKKLDDLELAISI